MPPRHPQLPNATLTPAESDLANRFTAVLTEKQRDTKEPLVAKQAKAWEHALVLLAMVKGAGWTPGERETFPSPTSPA